MPRFKRIYWSELAPDFESQLLAKPCEAIWPGPVDADACFASVGFTDFDDSDDAWDVDLERLVRELYERFLRLGPASRVLGELPVQPRGLFRKRKIGTLSDMLMCGLEDDNFGVCTVGFGEPASAWLTTSGGHPIVWVQPGASHVSIETIVAETFPELPHVRMDLDWNVLAPR